MNCSNNPKARAAQLLVGSINSFATWAPVLPRQVQVGLASRDGHMPCTVLEHLGGDARVRLAARTRTLRESLGSAELARCDVLLVEYEFDDGSGLDLVTRMQQYYAAPRSILICWLDDEDAAIRAFEAGAAGWLCMCHWAGDLVLSVLNVANGGAALSPSLARRLMRRAADGCAFSFTPNPAMAGLSERERDVLAQLARGLRNKEIARRLTISNETVNAHLKSIYRKLHVHSRTQLVSLASRAGMV